MEATPTLEQLHETACMLAAASSLPAELESAARRLAFGLGRLRDPPGHAGGFSDLGEVGPVRFQGGIILLQGHGCHNCGNGFWTEADRQRRLEEGAIHPCPHCGERSTITRGGG